MARVSHLITNALPGSWAWGRFSGGTVETWSGEAGNVQLNLSIKTQEPGRNNTIMIVLSKKRGFSLFLVSGIESKESGRKIQSLKKYQEHFSWQIKWTDGKGKRHSLCMLSPFFFLFFHKEYESSEWKYKHCQDMCDLLSWLNLKHHQWPAPHHSVQHSHSHPSSIIASSKRML